MESATTHPLCQFRQLKAEKDALELDLVQIMVELEGIEKCLDQKRTLEEETYRLNKNIEDSAIRNRKIEELNEAIRRARSERKAARDGSHEDIHRFKEEQTSMLRNKRAQYEMSRKRHDELSSYLSDLDRRVVFGNLSSALEAEADMQRSLKLELEWEISRGKEAESNYC